MEEGDLPELVPGPQRGDRGLVVGLEDLDRSVRDEVHGVGAVALVEDRGARELPAALRHGIDGREVLVRRPAEEVEVPDQIPLLHARFIVRVPLASQADTSTPRVRRRAATGGLD